MKLQDLICKDFPELTQQILRFSIQWREREIYHISADSRLIQPGWMFVAIVGSVNDGHDFVLQAIEQGASAIVVSSYDKLQDCNSDVPIIIVTNTRKFLSVISSRLYGRHPEKILAVTGTSGKTSVSSFIRQICQYSGFSAIQIGTSGVVPFYQNGENRLTTPDPVYLAQLLPLLASQGTTHVSIEASSHGLDQYRLDGIKLVAGAFTNLGRDHMDYHETVEKYFNAKMRLFKELLPKGSPAVIFADDLWSEKVMEHAQKAGCRVLSVGYKGKFIHLKQLIEIDNKQRLIFSVEGYNYDIILPLQGRFQAYNAIVAAGLCISIGIDVPVVVKALEQLVFVPGRFEFVGRNSNRGKIYVDYAHTPDSMKAVLENVRNITLGRIILVFGCGGDRDRGKRKIMGQIALQLSDVSIVTDDNPRSEDPAKIRAEIIDGSHRFIEEGNRQEAIRMAISMLKADDVLIVAGKGQEKVQIVKNGKTMLSIDCDIVREILEGSL
ncbi:MAG: UDP-N-acetylmuramoyl-L-alanyl-D-glutamate--2,6-diaminopimelate ligase [Candidatus Liberibacter europaeus]|uniref:UDP-N-acetylmuramoyl-L-alanyl-D-glutamate--2,6-diaminopimelate ligase n=1 Tax=Candidatus Liberibacter europaeus TaxID=744859 RepID=A0A2T4VWL1_9HYPH|nr:UDP-N-acetylmuramoyl-L-alanyl-D-glutamate--2,6-diaminopimelate ligase [Candidatus Liberibacter europaeus]PTL86163.1 MAG: UDP-N-acetylmuramoyl-L-alanyl-D-glutamate--2,6-diaminopimelate ligase [Candidatus Liberibacter europaeus]